MTSVKSCISKLGCRNDQAVWNTKKMTNANASRKKCQYRKKGCFKNEYWSWLRWWLERTRKSNNGGDLCTSVQKISRVFGMTLRRCYLRIGGWGVGDEDWEKENDDDQEKDEEEECEDYLVLSARWRRWVWDGALPRTATRCSSPANQLLSNMSKWKIKIFMFFTNISADIERMRGKALRDRQSVLDRI